MRGVFLDRLTVDRGDLDLQPLRSTLEHWRFHDVDDPEQTARRIRGARVVVCNKTVLDAKLLAATAGLELVCVAATGTDNIDLAAARRLGITVCNVRAYATAAVVQHVFALLLALTTRLEEYQSAIHAGRWQASPTFCLLDYPIRELAGKCLGIVGYGELGRAVARVAAAFGMRVQVAERRGAPLRPDRRRFREVLAGADVLSLHCPLTEQTRGLIGERELRLMKADAVLINTARGGLVDEPALAAALREGRLGGAGIDVLATEPPAGGSPLPDADIPRLIVTPHIAWASREARQRLVDGVAANIRAYREGRPRNRV